VSREESENLLKLPANPCGAFLVRYSNNRHQFILSGHIRSASNAIDKVFFIGQLESRLCF
jgi:hypothetical protein